MRQTLLPFAVFFIGLWSAMGQAPSTASSPAATSDPSLPAGLRVFTVGHSFHIWNGRYLADMARAAGIQGHTMGEMGLGGSRVLDCWNIPNVPYKKQPETNTAKEALAAGEVDLLTLSPIWLPDEGIENFVTLGLDHNPKMRATVQEFWLPNDAYEPKYPLEVRKQPAPDHNATDLAALRKAQEAYNHDVEEYVAALNKKLGRDVIDIVPVGNAVLALREKIAAGQAPGLTQQSELFTDNWGHPTAPLRVLSSYCHFAVIYRRSPIGLPLPTQRDAKLPNPELNRLLQELAWDAVLKCPMSGVKGTR